MTLSSNSSHRLIVDSLARRHRQIEARVIKSSDVPESYFRNQRRADREQGYGDIEIDDDFRAQSINVIQTDQRESLRDWANYLTDKNTNYPTWFKYYVYKSVTKLCDYDKTKQIFPRRSSQATSPFPSLNREALAYVYSEIDHELSDLTRLKHPTSNTKQDKLELKELESRLKEAKFDKLYAEALKNVGFADPELLKETRGSWVQYHQSEDPKDARRLSNSLKAYGTGWCTAGEGYAREQLADGDFYVYYTLGNTGKAQVPRIAVRMVNDEVAEVRGILGGAPGAGPAENTRQELEPAMIDIAMAKVIDLPGGEAYLTKAQDMKLLTKIDAKVNDGEELDLAELIFLHELEHDIQGFGYDEKDPRINKIRAKRDYAGDIMRIFAYPSNLPDQLRSRSDDMLQQASDTRRLTQIDQKTQSGQTLTDQELWFLYGFEGIVTILGEDSDNDEVDYNIITVDDVLWSRDKSKDLLRLAAIMTDSTDPFDQVQAEALKLIGLAADPDNNQLPPGALSQLHRGSDRLMLTFPDQVQSVIRNLAKGFRGDDMHHLLVEQQEQASLVTTKALSGAPLSTDDLKFIYEVNYRFNSDPQLADVLTTRDAESDIKHLLDAEPQYRIFEDDLLGMAKSVTKFLDIYKRVGTGHEISVEDKDYLDDLCRPNRVHNPDRYLLSELTPIIEKHLEQKYK